MDNEKNYNSTNAAALIERQSGTVYRLALSYTKNKCDAEDVMQNVFLKYIRKKRLFESPEHEKAWFIRVTINTAKTFFARKRSEVALDEIAELESADTPQRELSVLDAVNSLPKKQRVCTHLFYYEDYSVKEIAHALSIPESTVKSHLRRARASLKEKLKGANFDE